MGRLWDRDGASDVGTFGSLSYIDTLQMSSGFESRALVVSHTGVLKLNLDVEQGDDLALALTDIDVSFDTQDFLDLDGGAVGPGGGDADQVLVKVVLRPLGGVFVNPMPCTMPVSLRYP